MGMNGGTFVDQQLLHSENISIKGLANDCETSVVEMFITIFSAIFAGFLSLYRHTRLWIEAVFYFRFVECKQV